MNFFKQAKDGIMSYIEAVRLIFSRGLLYFYLFPVILQLAIIFGGEMVYNNLKQVQFGEMPKDGEEYLILWVGIKCIFYFASYRLLNYLVLILLSPMLTRLSYQTEYLLTGNTYQTTFSQYLKDVERAFRIILRNMLLQMAWITGWYVLTLPFPAAHASRYIFVFIIGSYFYGFSLMDYTNERMRLNIDDSVKFVRKHFLLAWCLGAVYYLLFIIPYAGVVLAPVTGIAAGTIAVHRTIDLSKNPHAKHAVAPSPAS